MSEVRMAWARNKSERLVHISTVKNGLACECFCSDCGAKVIAKRGPKNADHFSHYEQVSCSGESVLHAAAKQVLIDAGKSGQALFVPAVACNGKYKDCFGESYCENHPDHIGSHSYFDAKDEVHFGDLIVDILCVSNYSFFAVEIFYKHKKDEHSAHKFSSHNLECFEIDISDACWDMPPDEFEQYILVKASRNWIFSKREELELRKNNETISASVLRGYHRKFSKLVETVCADNIGLGSYPAVPNICARKTILTISGHEKQFTRDISLHISSFQRVIDADFKSLILKARAMINGRVEVDCIFLPICSSEKVNPVKPSIVIRYSFLGDSINNIDSSWYSIEKWQSRADEMLQEDINIEQEDVRTYVQFLSSLEDYGKCMHLSKKAGLVFDLRGAGRYCSAWRVADSVWKVAVILFVFRKNVDISTENVGSNKWLMLIFGLNGDDEQSVIRSKKLFSWFKYKLEPLGVVSHSKRLWWKVNQSSELLQPGARVSNLI